MSGKEKQRKNGIRNGEIIDEEIFTNWLSGSAQEIGSHFLEERMKLAILIIPPVFILMVALTSRRSSLIKRILIGSGLKATLMRVKSNIKKLWKVREICIRTKV